MKSKFQNVSPQTIAKLKRWLHLYEVILFVISQFSSVYLGRSDIF